MKRRIFIAINFEADVIKAVGRALEEAKSKIVPDLLADMRFIPERNWHLTISFLGEQDEDGIAGTLHSLKNAVAGLDVCDIVFDNLSYGPPGKQPRMIWFSANKKSSRTLGIMKERIEDELEENGVRFAREHRQFDSAHCRPFGGHITLARFDFGHEQAERLPILNQKVNISATVASLDLMESELRRRGAEYSVLQKFLL
jgi:2'-5' RNA ligase